MRIIGNYTLDSFAKVAIGECIPDGCKLPLAAASIELAHHLREFAGIARIGCHVILGEHLFDPRGRPFIHAYRGIGNLREVFLAAIVEEEKDLFHIGAYARQIHGYDLVIQPVVAVLVALTVVAAVVQGPFAGVQLTLRHAVACKKVFAVEGGVDVVYKLAVFVHHDTAKVKVHILNRLTHAEEATLFYYRSPVATNAEIGELRAVVFFQIDFLAFFQSYCHNIIIRV